MFVGGKPVTKAGTKVLDAADDDPGAQGVDDIVLTAEVPRYVSRAGLKLEAALEAFAPLRDAVGAGAVVLDAGLSTGGFADCLRQHGASKVYGVDVGYGQVAEKVRKTQRKRPREPAPGHALARAHTRARPFACAHSRRCASTTASW